MRKSQCRNHWTVPFRETKKAPQFQRHRIYNTGEDPYWHPHICPVAEYAGLGNAQARTAGEPLAAEKDSPTDIANAALTIRCSGCARRPTRPRL